MAATMLSSCVEPSLYPYEGLRGVDRLKYSLAYGDESTKAYAHGVASNLTGGMEFKNCPGCGGYGYYNAAPGLPKILNPQSIDRTKQYDVRECSRCRGLGVVAESKYVPAPVLITAPTFVAPAPEKTYAQEKAEAEAAAAKKEKARKDKEEAELNELRNLY